MPLICTWPQPVHVRVYHRFRHGRWETVREHCRSLPGRMSRIHA